MAMPSIIYMQKEMMMGLNKGKESDAKFDPKITLKLDKLEAKKEI